MSEHEELTTASPRPLVSVILTCFNHEAFVPQALDAVRAETYRPIELVVTDDASADSSADVIADWLDANWPDAIFIRHEVNVGLCRTLNEALALVSGEFVTITSGDDWMEPDRLDQHIAVLAAAPATVGLLHSGVRLVDGEGAQLALVHTDPDAALSGGIFRQQLAMPSILTPSVIVRRSVYEQVGGFNEADVVEDYDMWLRISRSFDVQHVPGALVNFRWHSGNTTTRIHGDPYDRYEATCLRRQLGYSDETDDLIRRRLDRLESKVDESGP